MSRIINEFIYLTLYLYKYQINSDSTRIHNIFKFYLSILILLINFNYSNNLAIYTICYIIILGVYS